MIFLSWAVRCFLWTSILHPSYQVIQDHFSPMSYPRSCACPDKDGKMYDLESLGSKDGKHPRFSANSTKYRGYAYSYNPCKAFHLGPKNSGCQRNVAYATDLPAFQPAKLVFKYGRRPTELVYALQICWWVLNLTQSADTYKAIGIQKGAKCGSDDDQENTPVAVYQASEEFPNRTSIVRLKCAEGTKDTTTFKILDEDNWKFQLTHFWEFCPTKSTQDPEPSTSVPGVVAGSVGGVFGLTFLIYAVRYCKKTRNANNNNDERQRILRNAEDDQQANVIHNPIEELNPAIRSGPSPICSPHAKPDVNVIRSVYS